MTPSFHRVDVAPSARHVVVSYGDVVLADTTSAVEMHETGIEVRWYIPRDDVRLELLHDSDHRTHCPFKGDASYLSYPAAGQEGEDLAWSYEQPFTHVAGIAGMLSFYPDRATVTVDDWGGPPPLPPIP